MGSDRQASLSQREQRDHRRHRLRARHHGARERGASLRRAHDELELRVRHRTAELASVVEELRSEITERKRAEEKVRRQQEQLAHVQRLRTIEGMASQLAHEINQPLAAIVNFANGLATRLRNADVRVPRSGTGGAVLVVEMALQQEQREGHAEAKQAVAEE